MSEQLEVVQRVLQLLKFGDRSSTYKHAVLIGLLDLCLETTDARGFAPHAVTTRQLAEKVIQLYWPQVASFDEAGMVLRQNSGKQGLIVREVEQLRRLALAKIGAGAGSSRVRVALPKAYEAAVRLVEWKLIEMPLPKLQRIEKQDTKWLYTIGWDDGANMPSRTAVTAYQTGVSSQFDNRITFQSLVAWPFPGFTRLLRPFVEQTWVNDVASQNRLEDQRLHRFLFGTDRMSLAVVRPHLLDLQDGLCFYCHAALGRGMEWQVDHFLPWSRHADNGLHNLVVADVRCNCNKSDFLAGVDHLTRWRRRNRDGAQALAQLSESLAWELSADTTLGAARALYLKLPPSARLWSSHRQFEVASGAQLREVLSG